MIGQDVKFVIEGTKTNPRFSFFVDGRKIGSTKQARELPVPYSLDETVKNFQKRWPEDKVTVDDRSTEEA